MYEIKMYNDDIHIVDLEHNPLIASRLPLEVAQDIFDQSYTIFSYNVRNVEGKNDIVFIRTKDIRECSVLDVDDETLQKMRELLNEHP